MINNIADFAQYLEFDTPDQVYIMLVMRRAKDGEGATQSSERKDPYNVKRRIIANLDDYHMHAIDLCNFAERYWDNYRLYITYNPRSLMKGYHNMQAEFMHTLMFKPREEYLDKLSRLDIWYKTYLHRPTAKSVTKYHMLDVDLPEVPELPAEIHVYNKFKTKNGWHVLCMPFNPQLVQGIEGIEFKQDAMLNLFIS